MNIYKIEKEYLEIADAIVENGGEVTPDQEQALALNKEDLSVKAIQYGYVIKNAEDDVARIDEEIKRLKSLQESQKKLIMRMKDTVANAMEMYNITEIKLDNMKIDFRRSTSVMIYDESQIPEEYKKSKVEVSISKVDIMIDLKANVKVPGAEIQEKQNIQFKKLKGSNE